MNMTQPGASRPNRLACTPTSRTAARTILVAPDAMAFIDWMIHEFRLYVIYVRIPMAVADRG